MKLDLKLISKKSLKTVWNHPFLWILGFFASMFITNRISVIILNFNKITNWIKTLLTLQIFQNNFQFSNNIFQNIGSLPISGIIIIIFSLFIFFYISFLAQVSIISYFSKSKNNSFKKLIKNNHQKVWKVALIYILSVLIISLILYLFKLSFKLALPIPILYYIVVFILISFFLGLLVRIIVFSNIINNQKIIPSIKTGWKLFWKRFFEIIKTCLYLFLISLVFGLGLVILTITTAFPFIALIALFLYLESNTGFQITLIIWPIIQSLILTILFAIFSAFQYSVWVNVFKKIQK